MIYRFTSYLSITHAKQLVDEFLPARDRFDSQYSVTTMHRIACIKALRETHHSAYLDGQRHVVLAYQFWQLGLGWSTGDQDYD